LSRQTMIMATEPIPGMIPHAIATETLDLCLPQLWLEAHRSAARCRPSYPAKKDLPPKLLHKVKTPLVVNHALVVCPHHLDAFLIQFLAVHMHDRVQFANGVRAWAFGKDELIADQVQEGAGF